MFGNGADQASVYDGNYVISSQNRMMSMLKIMMDKMTENTSECGKHED